MKKTLIALFALAGVASAETYTLDLADITFNGAASLSSGNQAMAWETGASYTQWYMEFKITGTGSGDTSATVTTGSGGSPIGLSVIVQKVNSQAQLSFGTGKSELSSSPTLNYSTSDVLTFAFYDGVAYIGKKDTDEYISYTITDTTLTTTMVSGTSKAWANGNPTGITPISSASIADLSSFTVPEGEILDMAKLVTKGIAESKLVPEPTTATLSLLALAGLAARRRRR